jgi:AcrR family transcriptional regulator
VLADGSGDITRREGVGPAAAPLALATVDVAAEREQGLSVTGLPNRDRRAERRQATRREILDIAWAIARRSGIAAVTLREVADLMGMRPPSLYSHFESKNAIYDAMFAESWQAVIDLFDELPMPTRPRKALLREAEFFFDFSVGDPARYQLMNSNVLHDFHPSEAAYQVAVDAYNRARDALRAHGVNPRSQADLDLWTALLTGAINQQLANDVGGTRWRRQLPRIVDMFCDEVGVPGPPLRRRRA